MSFFKSCKDCTERHVGCHIECERYLAEKAEYERIKAIQNSDREYRLYTCEKTDKVRNRQAEATRRQNRFCKRSCNK